ncbi:putative Toxin secretion ATP-binding protein [Candidatus Terasakiella magnetica]|uniref:Putative Toxin secretion ATP-binding protein n=1 Tax=Candidatus Terasakiella magnetica TaxID=1867952 RepID=A0A1C3RDJ1_9PROT|nr:peptidase domain-containing ABC transporter [Candidatus Terasakiella magnetica]SCA55357.1 putative Toxin secretion ATP-binding protein [Candidatus Terasakiella magnetica]
MNNIVLHQTPPKNLLRLWRKGVFNYTGAEELEPVLAAIIGLLDAMNWQGSAHRLVEALPYEAKDLTVYDLRDILSRLGYKTISLKTRHDKLSARLCPCVLHSKGNYYVVTEEDGKILARNPVTDEVKSVRAIRGGTFFVIEKIDRDDMDDVDRSALWFRNLFLQFKPLIMKSFGISFFINLMALTIPLAIMMIYDQVIAKESKETLYYVASGVGLALGFELLLRIIRSKEQAYIGARFDYLVTTRVFEQILHLPPVFTERAPVGGQVSRIRSFESLREIFTGSLANTILDLPFVLLFVAVIGFIAGPMVVVPLVLAALYAIMGGVVMPEIRARTRDSAEVRSSRYTFLVEMLWQMRQVKQRCSEDRWKRRFRELSGEAAWANLQVTRLQANVQNIAQSLMMASGVATLVFGVYGVMEGTISLGALVATMMLVWRILSPLQALFNVSNRIEQMQSGVRQLKSILKFAPEQEPGDTPHTNVTYKGAIEFARVSMRYKTDANPAMLGVSFKIKPGEMMAVTGHSGSGKTTLAKLILGLYRPQAGALTLDGVDIRQLRPITLRQTLAYVPQSNHVFPGTLYENLTLSDPTVSFAQVRKACRQAGILDTIEALPDGFETEFKEGLETQIPQNFLRKIALGRAFLRKAPVMILDEPAGSMDEKDEATFIEALERVRGSQTIIMITQRPSHMRLCDRLMVLKEGQVDMLGKPNEVLDKMFAKPKPKPQPKPEGTNT